MIAVTTAIGRAVRAAMASDQVSTPEARACYAFEARRPEGSCRPTHRVPGTAS